MIEPHASLAQLVYLARKGESDAINQLHERHIGMMLRTIEQIVRDKNVMEDLAQEAFMQALRKLNKLNKPASFEAWIRAISRNLALTYLRQKLRQGRRRGDCCITDLTTDETRPVEFTGLGQTPLQVLLAAERRDAVHAAVGSLGSLSSKLVWAYYSEGLTTKEIAALYKMPEGTVKSCLHRAKGKLYNILLFGAL
jgi:RNA polymerase sigma-70 factor, ECF subfamily